MGGEGEVGIPGRCGDCRWWQKPFVSSGPPDLEWGDAGPCLHNSRLDRRCGISGISGRGSGRRSHPGNGAARSSRPNRLLRSYRHRSPCRLLRPAARYLLIRRHDDSPTNSEVFRAMRKAVRNEIIQPRQLSSEDLAKVEKLRKPLEQRSLEHPLGGLTVRYDTGK